MRHVLLSLVLCTAATAGVAAPVQQDTLDAGAAAPLAPLSWGRLQGRLAFATTAIPLRSDAHAGDAAFKVSSLSLMGDYYLRPSLSQLTLGGLRATGGLMMGERNALWGLSSTRIGQFTADRRSSHASFDPYNAHHTDFSTTPYVGIGYSGTSRSNTWGFSADLGLMSLTPSTLGRNGRVVTGSQNLDDMVRDLRLTPVLQFGFSYAF